ncbi:MAG: hypothetical protein Q4C81_03145 [Kocuria sp.]|nr:hypothetical protein [Kocuria sp.]
MAASVVPAAPTTRHPSIRAPHHTQQRVHPRTRAADLHLMFLGLHPATAATAIILAGSGVRGFTILAPQKVTWDDAAAGAFDLPDIGLPREYRLRRRVLATNPQAVASSTPATFPASTCEGTLIIRSRTLHDDEPPIPATVDENHRVLDIICPEEHPPGTTMLWPVRPWYARACSVCIQETAGGSRRQPARTARHEAWPSHTALTAALTAQYVLATATEPSHATFDDTVTLLHPGAPMSEIEHRPSAQKTCALCSPE